MADGVDSAKTRKRARAMAIALAGGSRTPASRWPDWLVGLGATVTRSIELETDRRRLFLWLPVCFGLGIVAYFSAETEPSLLYAGSLCALASLAAVVMRASLRRMAPALMLAAVFAGLCAGILRARSVAAPVLAAPVFASIDGHIELIDRTIYGGRMVVVVSDMSPPVERMPARLRVTFRGKTTLESGAAIRFKARLTPPAPAALISNGRPISSASVRSALSPARSSPLLALRLRRWPAGRLPPSTAAATP